VSEDNAEAGNHPSPHTNHFLVSRSCNQLQQLNRAVLTHTHTQTHTQYNMQLADLLHGPRCVVIF